MEQQILWIIIGGGFGGLIKALFDGKHKLAKPVFEKEYFYMGFLANILIGIAAAILGINYFANLIDSNATVGPSALKLLATSIAFGISSNAIIEGIVEKLSSRTS